MTTTNRAACVIGWPVEHSRSPLIHNYWLKQYGIAGEYRRELVPREEFASFVKSLAARGYVGANVTVPHKEAALALSQPDERARAVGAVNTLWLEDGVLRATNTDVEGFLDNLDACAPAGIVDLSKAVVLGAGGAARAVVYGLLARGAERIIVLNRTLGRAETLRRQFGYARRCTGLGSSGRQAQRCNAPRQHHDAWHAGTARARHRPGAVPRPDHRGRSCLCTGAHAHCLRQQTRAVCAPLMGLACCCTRRCAALPCGSGKRPR